MKRFIGFVAGICMICCMSGVSVSMAVVARSKLIDIPYLVFFSCFFTSLGAFFWARTRKQICFKREHLRDIVTISIAGTAAVIPFFVIFTLGPAMMDWAENALFPIFVIALGIIMEKEYPSRRSWLGTCIAFLGFSLFLIPAVKATTPVHHFYVYAVLLPLLGAGGSAVSIMTMSRLSKKGIGRFYAMAVRYALPNLLLLIFSLLYGNSHNLTWLGILAAFIIGAGLMNGALYAALVVLKESGAFLLAVFVMLVPVATTCGERLFGLYTRSSIFYFGAAMILTGVAFIEFSGIFRNSWMKIKQRRDKFIRLTQ